MKWTVKLLAELSPGQTTEHGLLCLERPEQLTAAGTGLRLAEAKELLAALQRQVVCAQFDAQGHSACRCPRCGAPLRSRDFYPLSFRSLLGEVPVRVRRRRMCPCWTVQTGHQSASTAFCFRYPVAPELNLITAKLAAELPFRKAAALLAELLPVTGGVTAVTVRERTHRVGKRLERHARRHEAPAAQAVVAPGALTVAVVSAPAAATVQTVGPDPSPVKVYRALR